MIDTPKTLLEAVRYFSDPAVTFKAMVIIYLTHPTKQL